MALHETQQQLMQAAAMFGRDYVKDAAHNNRLNQLYDHIMRMPVPVQTMDAATGAWAFARQLEFVESEIYRVLYAQYKAREVFPVTTEGGPWTDTITYRVFDRSGTTVYINSNNSSDIPLTDVMAKEVITPVINFANKYAYTILELERAAHAKIPVSAEKAYNARDIIERKIELLAWEGDAANNVNGFLTNPDIPVANVVNGISGFPQWAKKTPGEILFDVLDGIATQRQLTLEVESPNKLLVPTFQYNLLLQPRSQTSDTTVLSWLIQNVPYFKTMEDIISVPFLAGQGVGGTDRMVIYNKNERKLKLAIPVEIKTETPILHDLSYNTIMRAATAGVIVPYPLSISFLDSI